MKVVRSSVINDGVVTLDNTCFVECEFNRCEIRYSGEIFALSHTALNDPRWVLTGPALRTVELLKHIGVVKGDPAEWKAAPQNPIVDPDNLL